MQNSSFTKMIQVPGKNTFYKILIKTILVLGFSHVIDANAQFTGHGGVYFLGAANIPISTERYSNENINGVVVRFKWEDIEPTPGNFNWTFIDGELEKATFYHKKVCLQALGTPDWMEDLGVKNIITSIKIPIIPLMGKSCPK